MGCCRSLVRAHTSASDQLDCTRETKRGSMFLPGLHDAILTEHPFKKFGRCVWFPRLHIAGLVRTCCTMMFVRIDCKRIYPKLDERSNPHFTAPSCMERSNPGQLGSHRSLLFRIGKKSCPSVASQQCRREPVSWGRLGGWRSSNRPKRRQAEVVRLGETSSIHAGMSH